MKPSKLYEALHALIGERVPLHIWGACGVGKSQIVSQVANDLDYDFLDVRAVQLDPVDLRGLPRIAADQTEWAPPKFLPNNGKGILFLDELTSAPQMTQAGCYQLVLDRKLGEYLLPEGWVVIAAGNPASERGVHFAMPRPFATGSCIWTLSRISTTGANGPSRLRFVPRSSPSSASSRTIAHRRHNLRCQRMAHAPFLGDGLTGALRASPAARRPSCSQERANSRHSSWMEQLGRQRPRSLWLSCGCFANCRRSTKSFSIPATAPVPAEPSAQIAIATALGRVMSDSSIGRGLTYLDRMPTEMRVMAMRDAAARDTAITHTPEFIRFGVEYREVIQ